MRAAHPSLSPSPRVARQKRRRKKLVGSFPLPRVGGERLETCVFVYVCGEGGQCKSPSPARSPFLPAEEALKEKDKPKEEEREKAKDTTGLECRPRPLHKTCSLFMRNIAPNISRAEIVSVSGHAWARDPSLAGPCL